MAVNYGCRPQLEKYLCCGVETPPTNRLLHFDLNWVWKPTRVGKGTDGGLILICGRKRSYFPFHCMVGPDWPIVIIVFGLIIAANIIVLPIISALGWPVLLIGLVGFVSLLASYAAVACSDPGIIYDPNSERMAAVGGSSLGNVDIESQNLVSSSAHGDGNNHDYEVEGTKVLTAAIDNVMLPSASPIDSDLNTAVDPNSSPENYINNRRVQPVHSTAIIPVPNAAMECGQCDIQRPKSARHCTYCGVCVEKLDHHCPWCGKCIGKNNIVFFHAFLTALCFQMYFLGGCLIYYFITLATNWPKGPKV